MHPILDRLSDEEIVHNFEEALNERQAELGVGFFTASVERDDKDELMIVLRVAAMVDTAGEDDFRSVPDLKVITTEFPEGKVRYELVEVVPISGMEIEAIYKPSRKR